MGSFEKHCLLLDPAALARGLKEVALRRGVQIFEQSPGEIVETQPANKLVVKTPRGKVRAERGLVATNAYAHSIPELRRQIFTIYAYALVTQPLTAEQWDRIGWSSRCGVEDRRLVVHGYRRTADGRIVWCGRDAPFKAEGPSRSFDHDPVIFKRLEESFRWTFPQLADLAFDGAWGGPICGTIDCVASVRWMKEERLLYALGYAGHGVGPSRLAAEIARDLLLGRKTDRLALPFFAKKPVLLPPSRSLVRFSLGVAERMMRMVDDDLEGKHGPVKRMLSRLFE